MADLTEKLTTKQSLLAEPIQELKFDKNLHWQNPENQPASNPVTMATDMIMLNRADSWMLQFKQKLNIGILGSLLAWATLAYYKGLETPAEIPESKTPMILADGSLEPVDGMPVYAVTGDSLVRENSADSKVIQPIPSEASADSPKLEAQIKPAAAPKLNKIVRFQMSAKSKAQLLKSKAENQKKNKKSLASKTIQD